MHFRYQMVARHKMGRILEKGEGRKERTEKQALAPHPKATLTVTPMTTMAIHTVRTARHLGACNYTLDIYP